jgi:ABC-type Fe3+/spermidine/putrescine transport system ATPase subunit
LRNLDNTSTLKTRHPQPAAGGEYLVEVSELVVKYGNVNAVNGVSLRIRAGEFLTLLGPSGCGKTTLLRAVAGLERPASGDIRVGGQLVYSSSQGVDVPAEHRNMSMVFQSYAIWPHMTAFENVVYGLRVRRRPAAEIAERGRWALDLVQMGQYADRRASALSGGQQQRIALARAVAFGPDVILFDEPLSNLDANLRVQMRREIKELQRSLGVTSLYVTHDQEESLTMSDRIIVMSSGTIEQEATPDELYDYPVNRFVANFIGSANLIPGCTDPACREGDMVDFVLPGEARIRAIDKRCAPKHECLLSIRAVYPQLHRVPPPQQQRQADAVNHWPCTIRQATFSGDFVEYQVQTAWGELTVRRPPSDRFDVGSTAFVSVAPQHCVVVNA